MKPDWIHLAKGSIINRSHVAQAFLRDNKVIMTMPWGEKNTVNFNTHKEAEAWYYLNLLGTDLNHGDG